MPTPVIEALFDSACVDVFRENQKRRREKDPGTVSTPVTVRTDLPINVGIKKEVNSSVLSAVGSVTPAVHKEAKKRLNLNVEQLKWNDTVKVAKTLVKEAQAKQAIQAEQESIKSAVKQREAAFKLQEELKVGAIYVRVYVAHPTYPLHDAPEFCAALLNYLTAASPRKRAISDADRVCARQ